MTGRPSSPSPFGGYVIGASQHLDKAVEEMHELDAQRGTLERASVNVGELNSKIAAIEKKLLKLDNIYSIPATREDLDRLGNIIGANFVIGAGLDRSQIIGVAPDRTAFACVARGIIDENVSYYFLLDLFIPTEPTATFLQTKLLDWAESYGWIDKVVVETFQAQDFYSWCIERGFEAEFISATYRNQELTFRNMYQVVKHGQFKAPLVPYYTDDAGNLHHGFTNKDDILREEMMVFYHQEGKWFGSPEKRRKGAVKDDVIYSVNYAIHATQGDSVAEMYAARKTDKMVADIFVTSGDTVGDYK